MAKRIFWVLLMSGFAVLTTATQASPAFERGGLRGSDHEAGEDRKACSNASLDGGFGFTATGTLLALPSPFAGPFAEIGRQTFDGSGNTGGTGRLSANGNIVRVTVQGTFGVNPDCTGSMTLYILPVGSTASLDFVIDADGEELRAIVTEAGAIESRVYKKQFSRGRKES
jgi:hypothetical protein